MDLRHPRPVDGEHDPSDRLVERYRTLGLFVTWHPPTRALLRTRPRPATAEVVDLSVSGALLLAPANERVQRGAVIDLAHDAGCGRVEVRHIHSAPDPAQQYYGVLFLELQDQLRHRLFDVVSRHRGDIERLERAWRTAH